MLQRRTSAVRIRNFPFPFWIFPTMILKLSQSAKKLKGIMRYVMKWPIVQSKIENTLCWDKKVSFSDVRSYQLSDVNFPIFVFFSKNFSSRDNFLKTFILKLGHMAFGKKHNSKHFSNGSVHFPAITWGRHVFVTHLTAPNPPFLFKDQQVLHWDAFRDAVFLSHILD